MFTTEEYFQYMSSPAWKAKKEQRIRIDAGRCRMCGTTENLSVHHLNYRTFQNENPWTDLVTVCENCHKSIHVLLTRPTGRNEDGSLKYGWKNTVPSGIVAALESRGLM